MARRGYRPGRKLNWKLLCMIALLHIAALYGLARVFAPDFTASVTQTVRAIVTIDVAPFVPPEPEASPSNVPEAEPEEGAAAQEGRDAVAREVVAPAQPIPRPSPAPRASSTGTANASGASEQGDGTGAGGEGSGTGSGRSGRGRGGIAVQGPSVKSGSIDAARDFPVPDGGRSIRYGTSVTVVFTVGVDGRARDCRISAAGPDPATNALLCPLVIERIRFNPAINAAGQAVPAFYGWRQDFFRP